MRSPTTPLKLWPWFPLNSRTTKLHWTCIRVFGRHLLISRTIPATLNYKNFSLSIFTNLTRVSFASRLISTSQACLVFHQVYFQLFSHFCQRRPNLLCASTFFPLPPRSARHSKILCTRPVSAWGKSRIWSGRFCRCCFRGLRTRFCFRFLLPAKRACCAFAALRACRLDWGGCGLE